ncbi:uncharacterized protein LOC136086256 [Hydra vulgaris]|uniref:Uncharacterized protein LOC136086256 n=1 Tax=Hydra vulgaris TaxID=6087 RepID=A0ABM4CRV2_HYDVU
MGFDGIHPRVLKYCAAGFATPLTVIFSELLEAGEVPFQWKKAEITPIFKKGCKSNPLNYRPISRTSVPCKVMESLVHRHITDHLNKNKLISSAQDGFQKRKGCVTNLLETYDILTVAARKGYPTDIIFTDFAKAFDKVPHRRLLHKLKSYGVYDNLYKWIESWLTERQQRVTIGNNKSDWKTVSSGVP